MVSSFAVSAGSFNPKRTDNAISSYLCRVVIAAVLATMPVLGASAGWGQAKQETCPTEPTSLKPTEPNIFSDQQEQWLGEALAELTERNLRFAQSSENAYLQAMGERMLAGLPPTSIHFQFRIYDSGELNAFGIAGGRIYVSRKVVAALQSEDELAGLLAHEIGHILAHQQAIEFTAYFRDQLGVTKVGDRADILDKFQKLMSADARHSHWHPPSEEHDQDVADQVAIYAMMRVGYQPHAYAIAFDRVTANKGKMGSGWSDFFGKTTESNRRFRADVKMAQQIPSSCMAPRPLDDGAFLTWQKLLAERTSQHDVSTQAERVLQLQEPLRSDLRSIRYSPDGKYLLAQDYATIFVIQRRPLKVLFSIPAEGSMQPQFTPDSSKLVFLTDDLRVEHWDVGTQQRVLVKELIIPKACDSQWLSPDGLTVVCLLIEINKDSDLPVAGVSLWDVMSGQIFFDKPNFVAPSVLEGPYLYDLWEQKYANIEFSTLRFSPDSRWMLLGMIGNQILYDLKNRTKVSSKGGISSLRGRDFIFLGDTNVLALNFGQPSESELYTFPEGEKLRNVPLGKVAIRGATRGNFVFVLPLKDFAIGLLDIDAGKIVTASQYGAVDAFEDELATQTPRGNVQITHLKPGIATEDVDLPVCHLGGLLDALITQDGKYLAISNPQRSAIWHVDTGHRVALLRPYNRLSELDNQILYVDFTKLDKKPRVQGNIDLLHGNSSDAATKMPEKRSSLIGDIFLVEKPDNEKKPLKNSTLEFHDVKTGAVAWSRRFVHSVPTLFRDPSDSRLGLWWALNKGDDREEINSDPVLKRAASSIADQRDGLILQVVEAKTGKVLDTLAVKEHKPAKSSRDQRGLLLMGDFLLVQGLADNTVIYRLSDKSRIGEVFGKALDGDAKRGIVALYNRRNEVFLIDANTANELARFALDADVSLARFVPTTNRLLVLTADQKIYTFKTDVNPVAAKE